MTHADEINAAANKLLLLTEELGDNRGPWYIDNQDKRPYPQSISNKGVPYCVATTTTDPHVPPYTALYICTMHPGVGKALAAWLQVEAFRVGRNGRNDVTHHALAVARSINGGEA
jgi:hypothetical protein